MSDGRSDGPGEAPRETPPATPVGGPRDGPTGGQILVGIFLVLVGLCVTLLGGGCTAMWAFVIFSGSSLGGGGGLLLVSLATLAGGVLTLWVGVKMLMGKFRT
jgi:hypothetical protein